MHGAHRRLSRYWFTALLLPVGSVVVHQLRYLLAYGSHAGAALTDQGDSYVQSLTPALVVLVMLALSTLVLALARVRAGDGPGARQRCFPVLWLGAVIALLVGYVLQESLEVVLGSAHTGLLAQAFGHGGWSALPAAVAVGLLWALVARGARAALAFVARRRATRTPFAGAHRADPHPRPPAAPPVPRSCPLARRHAGRAPPQLA